MWSSLYMSPSVAEAREVSLKRHRLGLLARLPHFPSWGLTWRGYAAPCTGVWTVPDRRGNNPF
jgi:hypothetical protein